MVSKEDILLMKGMVRWFDPSVLLKVVRPVIISGIFGQYADRRLIHAALDRTSDTEACTCADIQESFDADSDGAVWLDYAADTGDGFSSTYAIAYSLAQPELKIEGYNLRRGDTLVLGGDQVYPDASLETYLGRFRKPFEWAFPNDPSLPVGKHPLLFAIPGNHDWYDGLTFFLALFCKRKPWKIGNWRVPQRRSYFAIRLSETWWLWGVDLALSENVDQPQADYFESIARQMSDHSKVIICTAAPGWLYTRTKGEKTETHPSFSNLGYFAKIIKDAGKNFPIPLVLSGDTHHYCRYVAEVSGTQFVTAGGGGAFLHPTHQLRKSVKSWWIRANDELKLANLNKKPEPATSDTAAAENAESPACYPSQKVSKKLLRGNFWFPFKNWKFSGILGATYALFGLLLLMWNKLETLGEIAANPLVWSLLALQICIYVIYADDANWISKGKPIWGNSAAKKRKWILGSLHGVAHTAAIVGLSSTLYNFIVVKLGFAFWTYEFNAMFLISMAAVGAVVAGLIFGVYLYLACRFLSVHNNDAFSSLSLDSYKNFVRLKIQEEKLTLFPIGLDAVPDQNGWEPTTNDSSNNPIISAVKPTEVLSYRLIENPIVIS